MKKQILFLLIIALNSSAFCQSDSLLVAKLNQVKMSIDFSQGKLSGSGADFLIKEATDSHFLLLGENHGIAEVPVFTIALMRAMAPKGYKYYATEIGPETAQILTERLKTTDVDQVFSESFKKHPWSIPFLAWQDETAIVAELKRQTGLSHNNLWGLDQEFIISARMLLNKLIKIAPNNEAKTVAESYYEKALSGFDKAVETKVPLVFMSSATADDYNKLRTAFKGSEEALKIINEMQESQEVYDKLMVKRVGFESNQQRANMMKRNFMHYYDQAEKQEPSPRVIVKLGANHTYKGYNSLGAMDIGNFVHEFAASKRQNSFHVYIGAHKGHLNSYNLLSKSTDDKNKAFDESGDDRSGAFYEAANGEATLFDLRPLREMIFYKQVKNLHPNFVKLVFSYDAFLVIPEATPSKLYD
ncbi:hypothetical protein [Roseivirga sp. E12]|uniref:hypothetical protein n=1 Tax=Roseivirga sp. E12 TaxID=2819237 RepID=UPI001ABCC42B|nr:hypothetical protein [Roseivirga sp. E12]MBO3700859.1 hypothetical protein [Roseivirga sp. E12]